MTNLDHFAIAVRDANAAGDQYERLGFQVLPLMHHIELGSQNRIVQLHDTYLELVGNFENCVPYLRDRMVPRFQCGEGLAISSITCANLEIEQRRLATLRWQFDPIVNARRKVTMPDGSEEETDSSCIYVWRPERLYSMLFFTEHLKPHTIWVSAFQRHPNTAQRVTALVYSSNEPQSDGAYAADLLGYAAVESSAARVLFKTPRGEQLEYLRPELVQDRYGLAAPPHCPRQPCLGIALSIEVVDLPTCGAILKNNSVPHEARGQRLRVAAAFAHGLVLDFHASDH